ncbi:SDR family oxidoreductase [Tsukamurella tyrosinosolvens]|uniref:SDR family oxidoreductase n=1 Tax=Tsukamurella tyrosinosolvens TaxID=57704 RepID=UPI00079B63F3|nr:SDR family oxidoreductase [Tsukamurella tyrosinosolvens]KXP02541.1 short-chain dehydrogenase [Tsukamurella tyrosinosolvens]KZL96679.1 short-chain dehydrogenase [Tsukamurella tyrosinosolvens]MCA4996585.1 SDR family oxidoreductase [Tsukamurella tyrosinosolvens]WEL93923.1 SDR family oxidoreductase [Tsukamurella tyrosinosolvens]
MSATLITDPGPGAFADRTVVMSGGSRGIGLAVAVALAERGANVVLLAKTDDPDPRLPGTIHTAVAEIDAAAGRKGAAVGVVGDLRSDDNIARLVSTAVERFGGIDVCVNNASVLSTTPTAEITMNRYDLTQQVNTRGTFALTKACLPHLERAEEGRVVTLSPPLNLSPDWLGRYPAYMLGKYGMSLLTMGFAAEFADLGIAANCLWPETTIATAAVQNLLGGDEATAHARSPQIMADAAAVLLAQPLSVTGRCFLDAELVRGAGVADLRPYGGAEPIDYDLFVDPPA